MYVCVHINSNVSGGVVGLLEIVVGGAAPWTKGETEHL